MDMDHDFYMQQALEWARIAYDRGEVPVGAVLVYQGAVIAGACNGVEGAGCALAHAEMLCLEGGSGHLQNWRLLGTTLYCTLEPCAMCLGAILLSRVETLVWAAPDLRHGANGSWTDLLALKHPCHDLKVIKGVMAVPASELLRSFFRQRRQSKGL